MKFYDDGSCMHINIFFTFTAQFYGVQYLEYLLPSLASPACYQTRGYIYLRTHLFIFIEEMLMQSIHTLLQSRL